MSNFGVAEWVIVLACCAGVMLPVVAAIVVGAIILWQRNRE